MFSFIFVLMLLPFSGTLNIVLTKQKKAQMCLTEIVILFNAFYSDGKLLLVVHLV